MHDGVTNNKDFKSKEREGKRYKAKSWGLKCTKVKKAHEANTKLNMGMETKGQNERGEVAARIYKALFIIHCFTIRRNN